MLRSLNNLEQYSVSASDGELGKVVDFLLDDQRWAVRYLVVETGGFLDGRRVLISPISFRQADWPTRRFHLALTMDKIRNSPSVDLDKPVSRQHELDYFRYYSYPYYWGTAGPWSIGGYPGLLAEGRLSDAPGDPSDEDTGDIHLRSARELRGYRVQGSDAAVGEVDDFVVDDESWEIRYLAIDTGHWWFGKKVLIAPPWATHISWQDHEVSVAMSRQSVKDSPEWNAAAPINREYEERLYDYYGRPVYWAGAGHPQAERQAQGVAK